MLACATCHSLIPYAAVMPHSFFEGEPPPQPDDAFADPVPARHKRGWRPVRQWTVFATLYHHPSEIGRKPARVTLFCGARCVARRQ